MDGVIVNKMLERMVQMERKAASACSGMWMNVRSMIIRKAVLIRTSATVVKMKGNPVH